MFYLEAQKSIENADDTLREDIRQGQVVMAEAEPSGGAAVGGAAASTDRRGRKVGSRRSKRRS